MLEAATIYIRAYEIITQETFVLPDPAEVPLERIRRNLATYLDDVTTERRNQALPSLGAAPA